MKKYRCVVCEWIYDPAVGDPDGGIAPGTPFEEIPDDWACPVCGVGKSNSEEVEEQRQGRKKTGAATLRRSEPRNKSGERAFRTMNARFFIIGWNSAGPFSRRLRV